MTDTIIDTLELQYIDRLDERCQQWQLKHADDAKEIRESVVVQFRRPGGKEPEAGTMPWLMIEAAVNEAIRAKNGWPTFRRWLAERPPVPTPVTPRLTIVKATEPTREFHDHKSLAAGDR